MAALLTGALAAGNRRLHTLANVLEHAEERADVILHEKLLIPHKDDSQQQEGKPVSQEDKPNSEQQKENDAGSADGADAKGSDNDTAKGNAVHEKTWETLRKQLSAYEKSIVEEDEARRRVDRLQSEVGALKRQLGDLYSGKRLYDFVRERVESQTYTDQLGIISLIRRDFEKLSQHLKDLTESVVERQVGQRGGDRQVAGVTAHPV